MLCEWLGNVGNLYLRRGDESQGQVWTGTGEWRAWEGVRRGVSGGIGGGAEGPAGWGCVGCGCGEPLQRRKECVGRRSGGKKCRKGREGWRERRFKSGRGAKEPEGERTRRRQGRQGRRGSGRGGERSSVVCLRNDGKAGGCSVLDTLECRLDNIHFRVHSRHLTD